MGHGLIYSGGMTIHTFLASGLLLAGLALPPGSDGSGVTLSDVELADWAQTEASSYDDLFGRTVLLEFFAYW